MSLSPQRTPLFEPDPLPGPPTIDQVATEHASFLRATLRRLLVRAADIDDVLQQVLLATNRILPRFDPARAAEPARALRGLLHLVCVRCATTHRRRVQRRREVSVEQHPEVVAAVSDPSHDVEEQLLARERARGVLDLLAAIPADRREVVCAYDLQGESMEAIASALGVPLNTAWSRRHKGHEDLRAALRRRAASTGS